MDWLIFPLFAVFGVVSVVLRIRQYRRDSLHAQELRALQSTGVTQGPGDIVCGACGVAVESVRTRTCPACGADLGEVGIVNGQSPDGPGVDGNRGMMAAMGMFGGAIFVLVGLVMTGYVAWAGAAWVNRCARAVEVTAAVIKAEAKPPWGDADDGEMGSLRVTVRYSLHSQEFTSDRTSVEGPLRYVTRAAYERDVALFAVGKEVGAYVNPHEPGTAVVTRSFGSTVPQAMGLIFVPAFLGLGMLAWRAGRDAGRDLGAQFERRWVERDGATITVYAQMVGARGGWNFAFGRRAALAPLGSTVTVCVFMAFLAMQDVVIPPPLVMAGMLAIVFLMYATSQMSRLAIRTRACRLSVDLKAGSLTLYGETPTSDRVVQLTDIRRLRCTDMAGRDCLCKGKLLGGDRWVVAIVGEAEEPVELGGWIGGIGAAASAARWFAKELSVPLVGDRAADGTHAGASAGA